MLNFKWEAFRIYHSKFNIEKLVIGGLAQLARAPALHAGGQRFESVILHLGIKNEKLRS